MSWELSIDLSLPIVLECLECTCAFSLSERIYREQEKVFCPKCGKTNVTRYTNVIVA